jgi:hypothetical protein
MDNFFNNGPTFLKSTVGIRIYHILITSRKKCRFENWIFKIFF